jgi:N utilization substance protein A
MANHGDNRSAGRANVDLSESSVYGNGQTKLESNDVATADRIDRLEAIIGGAEEEPLVVEGKLGRQFDALDASTEEELDALKVDLVQDGDPFDARDGSGRVDDDVAEEQIAAFTEVGPAALDRGGESVAPGRDDTSAVLLRHRQRSEGGGDSDAIVEGYIDPPLDEELEEDAPERHGQASA